MNCPACDRELSARALEQVMVNVCEGGCGGIWLDAFELARVDEQLFREVREIAGDPGLAVNQDLKRACPRCEGIKMQHRFFSSDRRVEVDACPGCGGYWLDAGELNAIRADGEQTRKKAGPIRVHLPKTQKKKPGSSGPADRIARAQTLDSLYRILGSKY